MPSEKQLNTNQFNIKEFYGLHKRLIILLSILFVTILIAGVAVWQLKLFSYNRSFMGIFEGGSHISPSPTPKPSPRPIPHGKISFTVGSANKSIPQLGAGSIDPYDPQNGGTQTVTVSAKDEQPITQVTAVLKTDNAVSQPVSFKLVEGSATSGTWQGSWTVTDTYLYTYNLVLTAVSSRGQGSIEITLR